MFVGIHRPTTKRLKAARKASMERSVTVSKWTAFVDKQMNNARYISKLLASYGA